MKVELLENDGSEKAGEKTIFFPIQRRERLGEKTTAGGAEKREGWGRRCVRVRDHVAHRGVQECVYLGYKRKGKATFLTRRKGEGADCCATRVFTVMR